MKNRELYGIINEVNSGTFDTIDSTNFNLALVKNIQKIEDEIVTLEKLRAVTDKYKEFLKEVNNLKIKFAKKDSHNKPIVKKEGNREVYDFGEDVINLNNAIEELKESHDWKPFVDEYSKKEQRFIEALDKECDINFKKVKRSDLPSNLKFKTVYFLSFMIDD